MRRKGGLLDVFQHGARALTKCDLSRHAYVLARDPRGALECAIVARWSAKSERMDSPIFSVSSAVCTAPRILSLALFSRSLVAISRERWLSASMLSHHLEVVQLP